MSEQASGRDSADGFMARLNRYLGSTERAAGWVENTQVICRFVCCLVDLDVENTVLRIHVQVATWPWSRFAFRMLRRGKAGSPAVASLQQK
jgi:hypothetical protein